MFRPRVTADFTTCGTENKNKGQKVPEESIDQPGELSDSTSLRAPPYSPTLPGEPKDN